jgi:orotate phosphoribosyltransferase
MGRVSVITEAQKQKLAVVVLAKAVARGEFTLASGKKSSFYIDCRNLMYDKENVIVALAFAEVLKEDVVVFDAVGGPGLGAAPLTGVLTGVLGKRGFAVRSEEKNHGKPGLVCGPVKPGDKVVLIEDVTTSGESLAKAAKAMKDYGCTVMHAVTLVDREAGARQRFRSLDIPFKAMLTLKDLGLKEGE